MGRDLKNRCSVREGRHRKPVCDSVYAKCPGQAHPETEWFMAARGGAGLSGGVVLGRVMGTFWNERCLHNIANTPNATECSV